MSGFDAPPSRGAEVRFDDWGWRHGGRRDAAVSGVTLRIAPGERVLLVGPSGSGKSTLLHAMAGLLGDVDDGESSGTLTVAGRSAAEARGVAGLVLQDPDTQAVMRRVADDVAFGLENQGVAPALMPERVRQALEAVGLGAIDANHNTSELSGGQKQRLALAGVLAMDPSVLLLDEPTANLDPAGATEVRAAVAASGGGRTVVVVEHDVLPWREHVDRVIALGRGGEVALDLPAAEAFGVRRAELAALGIGWDLAADDRAPVTARPVDPSSQPVLLRAIDVTIGRRRQAVRTGIDLEVRAGRALVIAGRNGGGKSTLALTLAGVLPPLAGGIEATPALADGAGPDPSRWRSAELASRIGLVFQSPDHQLLARTVGEDVAIGPRVRGVDPAETAEIVQTLLARLRLEALERAHPLSLSVGQKRRLSVATVLAASPRVLVLDEPTFGQDAGTRRELLDLLAAQADAGRALVIVSHDPDLPAQLAQRGVAVDAMSIDELGRAAPGAGEIW